VVPPSAISTLLPERATCSTLPSLVPTSETTSIASVIERGRQRFVARLPRLLAPLAALLDHLGRGSLCEGASLSDFRLDAALTAQRVADPFRWQVLLRRVIAGSGGFARSARRGRRSRRGVG
jgi:hypothetical protein